MSRPGGPRPALLLLVPMLVERAAIAGAATGATIATTGVGRRRALAAAERGRRTPAAAVAIAGLCGGLTRDLLPGDVVVATAVTADGRGPRETITLSSGPLIAALRTHGLRRVHAGHVVSSTRIVHGSQRVRLAARGAIAVDMESAWLSGAAGGRPLAVLRVVGDTPSTRLRHPLAAARGLLEARRSLRRAVPALTDWARAAGDRHVLVASPRSFCAGAQRAIEIVERALDLYGSPVYVRKQIVHNIHVVRDLQGRGARFVDSLQEIPPGSLCIFSAHGVSPAVRQEANELGLRVIDATCPLVAKVHKEARRFAASGHRIVLIGHRGHDEVVGTVGEAPGAIVVVTEPAEVNGLDVPDRCSVAYLTQTTLAVDEVREVVERLRGRFPQLEGPASNDICYATSNRQDAVRAIARDADLVLVIGSSNSSNSRRLVEIAEREGCEARLIDDDTAIDPVWLAGRSRIGVTAGASAPQRLVDEVVAALAGLGRVEVEERCVGTEAFHFTLPPELSRAPGRGERVD